MKRIKRFLIVYCASKALKYDQMKKMLLERGDYCYTYSIGVMVVNYNKWMDRVFKLQKWE